MAGYTCDTCAEKRNAVLVITPLNGGETMASCGECIPVTLTGMLAGTVGIDADKLYDAITKLMAARDKAAAAPDGQGAAEPALPRRQAGQSGRRPARPSRQDARTAAAAAPAGGGGAAAPPGGDAQ